MCQCRGIPVLGRITTSKYMLHGYSVIALWGEAPADVSENLMDWDLFSVLEGILHIDSRCSRQRPFGEFWLMEENTSVTVRV